MGRYLSTGTDIGRRFDGCPSGRQDGQSVLPPPFGRQNPGRGGARTGTPAAELGKTSPDLPCFQVGLGIAEYRSGRFVEADASLLAGANGGITNSSVVFTAAFYRAMSLFRQGKEKEARQLASGAAIKMKPLPKDEENPLAGGNDADDLILWLTYKEALAMIKFGRGPGRPHNARREMTATVIRSIFPRLSVIGILQENGSHPRAWDNPGPVALDRRLPPITERPLFSANPSEARN